MQIVVVGFHRPVRLGAIVEFDGRSSGLKFLFTEQSVLAKCVVPPGEIFEIRIDAAIAERCGGRAPIGFFERVPILGVAEGAAHDFIFSLLENDGVIHFQRGKNSFAQEITIRFS